LKRLGRRDERFGEEMRDNLAGENERGYRGRKSVNSTATWERGKQKRSGGLLTGKEICRAYLKGLGAQAERGGYEKKSRKGGRGERGSKPKHLGIDLL